MTDRLPLTSAPSRPDKVLAELNRLHRKWFACTDQVECDKLYAQILEIESKWTQQSSALSSAT